MKTHFPFPLLMSCLLALSACSGAKPQPAQKPSFERGARIFDVFCAQCHLNSDYEAPQLDEDDDWDLRTHEWTSILKDHAKKGFLDMPAKGGHPGLTDQSISDALYYMQIKIQAQQ